MQAAHFDGIVRPLEEQMTDDGGLWRRIAEREKLAEPDLARLVSPWHTDADLGRPIEVLTDMSKSRRLGFTSYQRRMTHSSPCSNCCADRLIP